MINDEIRAYIKDEAKNRFLRYVKINTRSDPDSETFPSFEGELDLARVLRDELNALGLSAVEMDKDGYVYATLPASQKKEKSPPVCFCAHMDTSSAESGENVEPVVHENYDGGVIRFKKDDQLTLSPTDAPYLTECIGENIITAAGDTLLGADNKAGIAEIMAALAAFIKYDQLTHPEIRIIFTPDEEIGKGADRVDTKRFGKVGYTIDGGRMGEIEEECFDAYGVNLTFIGRNIHPGEAKNKMINAAAIAARFLACLPESETPEHTELREGFYHLLQLQGDENKAVAKLIIRDFDKPINLRRIEYLRELSNAFEVRYNGLSVELDVKEQYQNMKEVLVKYPEVVDMAQKAIEMAGIKVRRNPIRGGTDGARMCFMGMPTPNIFTGGSLYHSRKEWIPENAFEKATEVIIILSGLWAEEEA